MKPDIEMLRRVAVWAVSAFVLHSVWEFAQLPLYTLWREADAQRLVVYVLHCVAGDVMIALTTFILTSLMLRDGRWLARRPWRGGMLLIGLGLGYTGFSEWYNVYRAGAWSYAPAMPLIAGIGLAPLLQWVVVPAAMMLVMRRLRL